ncbi:MAG: MerR family transcriptional regulator [Candidatus Limnocylindria bacterium]|nr:MerR family transcriptional regulator [Candidatus Limnocylindria bacterium]
MARGGRPVYIISIAAGLTGCHPRTLRIYEEEGLLEPVRTPSNIRLYSDEDVMRVRMIRYLTQVRGVNLAGVKMVLQLRDIADLMRDFAEALDAVDAEREDVTAATSARDAEREEVVAARSTRDAEWTERASGSSERGHTGPQERRGT